MANPSSSARPTYSSSPSSSRTLSDSSRTLTDSFSSSTTSSSSTASFSSAGKLSWPELVGEDADYAVSVIEKENPSLKICEVRRRADSPDGQNWLTLHFDKQNKVAFTPIFKRRSWPELVGEDKDYAVSVIKKECNGVKIFERLKATFSSDFEKYRVWVHIDENNKVDYIPNVFN